MHQNSKFMYPLVPVIVWRRMPQELTQPVLFFGCDYFNLEHTAAQLLAIRTAER
jgi:hypothetical protein